jgi:hypothetical protein
MTKDIDAIKAKLKLDWDYESVGLDHDERWGAYITRTYGEPAMCEVYPIYDKGGTRKWGLGLIWDDHEIYTSIAGGRAVGTRIYDTDEEALIHCEALVLAQDALHRYVTGDNSDISRLRELEILYREAVQAREASETLLLGEYETNSQLIAERDALLLELAEAQARIEALEAAPDDDDMPHEFDGTGTA